MVKERLGTGRPSIRAGIEQLKAEIATESTADEDMLAE
jgi:hypothetical protein